MALPRKHNLEQMKKLRQLSKGDIGDVVAKGQKKKESGMANSYWIDNPLDRSIDTYESFIKKDNKLTPKSMMKEKLNQGDDSLILWENYINQNEDFVNKNFMNKDLIILDIVKKYDYKNGINKMSEKFEILLDEHLNLGSTSESVHNKGMGPGNTSFYSNSSKQVLTPQLSIDLLQIGKFVKVGKIEGYINSLDEENVYISTVPGLGTIEKVPFKKFLKQIKEDGKILENSGFPSEFWTEEPESGFWEDEPDTLVAPDEEVEETQTEYEEEHEYEVQREYEEEHEYEVQNEFDVENYEKLRGKPGRPRPPKETNTPIKTTPPIDKPVGPVRGTEDNPSGIRENVYVNDFKSVKCDDCGQLVEDTYKAKVGHIYNKHFNKTEMDGAVPQKVDSYDTTWPQGGAQVQKQIKKYFPL